MNRKFRVDTFIYMVIVPLVLALLLVDKMGVLPQ